MSSSKSPRKITTLQIATAGVLLALMIVAQLFKNVSVYITGPVVNAVLIIATLSLGPIVGIILSVISPLTAFLISASPVMKMVPLIIPAIMCGNIILCMFVFFLAKHIKKPFGLPAGLIAGSVFKALFMGGVISNFLLVTFAKLPAEKLAAAQFTFSVTQLITALTGSVLAYLIWLPLSKAINGKLN